MIISAHQPAYIPWCGYLQRIALCEKFIILDDVQFEKNSFVNRNQIKGPNGPFWLTVPVNLKDHIQGTIKNTPIANDENWQVKHWKSLKHNYASAPYFKSHEKFLESVFTKKWDYISELNEHVFKYLLKQFNINTEIYNLSSISVEGNKQDLILSLCKYFKASKFIFGSQGRDYAEIDLFKKQGIEVCFHEYVSPEYVQRKGDFIPNLSAVDVIFNIAPEELHSFIMKGGKLLDQ